LEEDLFPLLSNVTGTSIMTAVNCPRQCWVAFLASGWGMYRLQLPPVVSKGKLLKQRVVGLVGAECRWECSPITLVAVTTSYLVHGLKAKLLCVYLIRSRWASR
jgi:hypothetical protein